MIYEALNETVLARVPRTTKRLLDLGCGSGSLGQRIKAEVGCQVVGITSSEAEASLASQRLDEVLERDLNKFEPRDVGQFDCIICSHVLEHLNRPDRLLTLLRQSLSPDGTLIVSLPNALHWRQRLKFLLGHFKYTEGGLMDQTHYRFFDWETAQALLIDSGYRVLKREAEGSFPLSRFLFHIGTWLDRTSLKVSPGLFGFQFILVCIPNPNSDGLKSA